MRKNLLADLVGRPEELTPVNLEESPAPKPAPLGSKGAVGAMSRALKEMKTDRESITRAASAQDIVDIDTALIDRSIVRDRMRGAAVDHQRLVASLSQHGQQVPILLRPHPDITGRYQIAYGHRRVEALRELGIAARAIVRELTDNELVVAQGQENSARKDLSYIERGTFGVNLEDRGFGRETIMAALSVDKTELSRLISVARSVPHRVKEAIGPAPRAGRRRWMELAERLSGEQTMDGIGKILDDPEFLAIDDSDARFARLFEAVAPRQLRQRKPRVWVDPSGRKLARIERAPDRFTLSIDEKMEPEFGDYLLDRLPEILASFQRREKV